MSTNGRPRPQGWEELYQLAMLETDPAKLSPLIADAHKRFLTGFKRLSLNPSPPNTSD